MIVADDYIVKQEAKSPRKLYRCTCDNCGCDRGYKRLYKVNGLCRSCFGILEHTGKQVSEATKQKISDNHYLKRGGSHPLTGKHHSEATKQLLSAKQEQFCAKYGNQFVTGKSQGKHSVETVNKISAGNSGKEPHWKGRTFLYSGLRGSFKMRSSYELFYAKWLDDQNIQWEYEPQFKLSTGKMFSPDFRLDNGVIIEVKGYWAPIGKAKWELFCTDYPDIIKHVLMKTDLIKLGMKE